ncbi:hypothetical protein DEO72_LG9g2265 [Vigna unguiculata]|uniref:Agenet domain-containing protein n=1 Tax=Vigna unguiculata TaxID=3917 RepID=A0A4D6N1U6_VIGUN|nr:hypothetical protein DEO72_LG9g2265 [Vigna unguiculata]
MVPKPKTKTKGASASAVFFKPGTVVEVSSEDEGFRGSWFSGTVIRHLPSDRFLIEYHNLMADDKSSKRLREILDIRQLRPILPPEIGEVFKFGDEVDAYYNDGWWEGFITEELENDRFAVYFRASKEQLVFSKEQLRIHREWFDHKWEKDESNEAAKPDESKEAAKPDESNEAAKPDESKEAAKPDESNEAAKPDEFGQGATVEVSNDEDGFSGAWFEATIVEAKGNDKFVVEYQTLLADDDSNLLREEIDALHIRPPPPNTNLDGQFSLLDEVDALYNDGWWVGVISKVLADSKYVVYFRSSNEELEFHHSQLRLHQDWIHGKWIIPCKVWYSLKLCDQACML